MIQNVDNVQLLNGYRDILLRSCS